MHRPSAARRTEAEEGRGARGTYQRLASNCIKRKYNKGKERNKTTATAPAQNKTTVPPGIETLQKTLKEERAQEGRKEGKTVPDWKTHTNKGEGEEPKGERHRSGHPTLPRAGERGETTRTKREPRTSGQRLPRQETDTKATTDRADSAQREDPVA